MTALHSVPDDPAVHAEMAVLGSALITGGRSLDDCQLRAEDFSRVPHAELWTLIARMYADGQRIDSVTVEPRLRDNPIPGVDGLYLHRLEACVPSPASAGFYADQVREASDLRALRMAGTRMAQSASTQDAETARTYARQVLDGLDGRDTGTATTSLGDVVAAVMNSLDEKRAPGMSLPWPDLDDYLGGLRPGLLYVIGARPAVGKSVVGMNIAWNAAHRHGQAALLHSLEMPADEVGGRMISAVASVSFKSIVNRKMTEPEWARVNNAYAKLAEAPLHIDDRATVRISDIRARVRQITRKAALGVVVVDYLQLLTPSDQRAPREQQVAEMSRALKLLAKDSHVPVVLLAQLNRQVESRANKRPLLSDLRESGAIEQDADVVLLLYRDEEAEDVMEVSVAKNRQGPQGVVSLRWEGHHMRAVSGAWS